MRVLIHISFHTQSLMAASIKCQSSGSMGMMSDYLISTPKKECIPHAISPIDLPSAS